MKDAHPHQKHQYSRRDSSTNMDPINMAIPEIESLKPGEEFPYTEIAAKYVVVRTTLSRRHQGKTRPVEVKYINQQCLTHTKRMNL